MIDITIVLNRKTTSNAKKEWGSRTELMRLVARHVGADTRMMSWNESGLYNLDGSFGLWKACLEKDQLTITYRGPVGDVEPKALAGLQAFLQWRLGQ